MDHQSMQSAVFVRPQTIQIEQRPVPTPGVNEALIQVEYAAICGSDQALFWDRTDEEHRPVVMGHEFSGRIVTAPDGSGLPPGQRVTVAPLLNCGSCEFCQAGRENLCRKRRLFGITVDGAFQEFVRMPADRIFPLPDDISLADGALIEPLAVAYHTVRQADSSNSQAALVLGAGAIGLLIAQVWRALGKGTVVIADIDPSRLAVAAKLDIPVQELSAVDVPFDMIFEATGSSRAISTWLPRLAPGGKVVVVSKLTETVTIDWIDLLRKEGQIITSRYFTLNDFAASLQLVAARAVQLQPLAGQILPFEAFTGNTGQDIMHLAGQVVRLLVCMCG
jgi:2-desacetyl-2-hydroxyethyl bacteriochlorophyllide A dehydrogenase